MRALIVADLLPHSTGGHFRVWLERTLREAAKSHDAIVVYIGDERDTPPLDGLSGGSAACIHFHDIRRVRSEFDRRSDVFGAFTAHQAKLHRALGRPPVLVMWAEHYLNRNHYFPPVRGFLPWPRARFDRPWGTLFSFATLAYAGSVLHPQESAVHALAEADPLCRGAFCWDEAVARQLGGKLIYLPNVEDTRDDPGWRMDGDRFPVVGSVGQLWGYRSMNLLFEIITEEPGVSGYAAGQLFPESYDERATALVSNPPERFTLEAGRLPNEAALDDRLKRLDAFVVDSRTYKVPSGLAIRAMAMGRPLVSLPYDSWVSRHIAAEGVGLFWRPGEQELARSLRTWHDSGGPERSRRLAAALNDRKGLEHAFAEMFRRLHDEGSKVR